MRPPALKSLRRINRPDRERILDAIGRLPDGDVLKLHGTANCGGCASANGESASTEMTSGLKGSAQHLM